MILDIQFKNYRSFKDKCNFSMEASSTETKANNVFVAPVSENDEERLLKIAIIYGANASGKTNIIRMLYALRSMISNMTANQGGEGIYLYEPFVLDEDSKNEPTEISISFIVNNIKHFFKRFYLHTKVIVVLKGLKISIFLSTMNLMEPVNYLYLVVKSCNHLKVEVHYLWMKWIQVFIPIFLLSS